MTETIPVEEARCMTPRTQSRDAQDYLLTLMPVLSDALTAAVIARPRDPYLFIAHEILKQSTLPTNSIIFPQIESFLSGKPSTPAITASETVSAAVAPAPSDAVVPVKEQLIEPAPIKPVTPPAVEETIIPASVIEPEVVSADEEVVVVEAATEDEPVAVEPTETTESVEATVDTPVIDAPTESVDDAEAPAETTAVAEVETAASAPIIDAIAVATTEVTAEPVTEPIVEPIVEPIAEPTAEITAEIITAEPTAEPVVEAAVEESSDPTEPQAAEAAVAAPANEEAAVEPAAEGTEVTEATVDATAEVTPEIAPAAEEASEAIDSPSEETTAEAAPVVEAEVVAEAVVDSTSEVVTGVINSPRPLHIIIAGAACSGKGTQCELIKKKYSVVHISTGDLLREEAKAGTELGVTAKSYMDKGLLLPDELIIGIVNKRLNDADCLERGWLLDGFPRSAGQAEALIAAGINADVFFVLDVPDDVLIERVVGRRMDPQTGDIYHLKFSPPTDETVVARLIQRDDDTEEKIKTRLESYHNNVASIEGLYKDIMIKLNGNQNKDIVFESIDTKLGVVTATPL